MLTSKGEREERDEEKGRQENGRSRPANKICRGPPTTRLSGSWMGQIQPGEQYSSTPHPPSREMKGGYGFRGPKYGAYGGGKNGGYYNPKGGQPWGMNGKGAWSGAGSWGNTGGGYGGDGGGKGAIKELCGMMAYQMEREM